MGLKKIQIYGERCSGTNFLKRLLETNFDVEITDDFGHKHFFGFQNLRKSDDVLFICIVRDPLTWLNSFYRMPWHIAHENRSSVFNFLNNEMSSYYDNSYNPELSGKEIREDRHIFTKKRYKNIFELRHTKIKWMLVKLPRKVKNYIFIRYEDLLHDFDKTMYMLKMKGLDVRDPLHFPQNYTKYKDSQHEYVPKKYNDIKYNDILSNKSFQPFFEKKLGYL